MEKLNFISSILDKWTNLTDKKKLSYLTGIFFILAGIIIWGLCSYFITRIDEIENEKIQLKNDYIIDRNRLDNLLSIERKKTEDCDERFIKYLEKNEKEVRDILFYTEKYKVKK